ncbi:MAG: esterase family protein [Clostridiales bacterium]|nr:esterase family protein [Clostridiales bacterium]
MGLMHFSFLPQSLGFHTNVYVILPYDNSMDIKPYKVLYLLHGGAGNAQDWTRFTSIERYAEEHKIAVVMPEVGGSSFYADMVHGYKYYSYLTEELPMVLNCFLPLSDRREDRFVAGLSMGGYGAFKWAFDKPEYFSAAGNFSGFSFIDEILSEDLAHLSKKDKQGISALAWGSIDNLLETKSDTRYMVTNAVENKVDLPRLYAAIGTEDFSYEHGQRYLEFMRTNGVEVKYEEMPGAHDWNVWDQVVNRFIKWALEL